MERKRQDGLTGCGRLGGEGQAGNTIVGGEGVGGDAEDGDVMGGVGGNDGGRQETWRGIGSANNQVGMAAIAEGVEDMGVGEEITVLVDEEGVAEEGVVIAARGGGFVEAIDDRADGGIGGDAGRNMVGDLSGEGAGESG